MNNVPRPTRKQLLLTVLLWLIAILFVILFLGTGIVWMMYGPEH